MPPWLVWNNFFLLFWLWNYLTLTYAIAGLWSGYRGSWYYGYNRRAWLYWWEIIVIIICNEKLFENGILMNCWHAWTAYCDLWKSFMTKIFETCVPQSKQVRIKCDFVQKLNWLHDYESFAIKSMHFGS